MTNTPNSEAIEKSCASDIIHVMHVDDDPEILSTSKMMLEADGKFRIEMAPSVDEALHKLQSETFDAVISDYEMPKKNGLQFLEELRGQKTR